MIRFRINRSLESFFEALYQQLHAIASFVADGKMVTAATLDVTVTAQEIR